MKQGGKNKNKKEGKNDSLQSKKKADKVRGGGSGGGGSTTTRDPKVDHHGNSPSKSECSSSENNATNRPRNWLLRDATSTVAFQFDAGGGGAGKARAASAAIGLCELRVRQSADDETWPGGALWDSGVILAQLLAALPAAAAAAASAGAAACASKKGVGAKSAAAPPGVVTITASSTATTNDGGSRSSSSAIISSTEHRHSITVPSRLMESDFIRDWLDVVTSSSSRQGRPGSRPTSSSSSSPPPPPALTVLELGCGVGLTGMVASVSLRATITLLTDLAVVVDKVTQPNRQRNMRVLRRHNRNGIVRAVPLCWGCERDEANVREILRQLDPGDEASMEEKTTEASASIDSLQSKGGGPASPSTGLRRREQPQIRRRVPGLPDWILVGDVAYQHRPGAPSHFDALLSTLLTFTSVPSSLRGEGTRSPVVVFATRVRMPASVDLLEMLRQHFDEMVEPPIEADEVNGDAFRSLKHNMTIHFLRRKPNTKEGQGSGCRR
jgi:hypothetical protein